MQIVALSLTTLVSHLGKSHRPVEVPYAGVALYLVVPLVLRFLSANLLIDGFGHLILFAAFSFAMGLIGVRTYNYPVFKAHAQ